MCPIVDKYFHERAKVRKNKQNKAFGWKLFIFLSKYVFYLKYILRLQYGLPIII